MNLTSTPAARLSLVRLCLLAAGSLLVTAAPAAPVLGTTAVQTQPDPSAPVISYLKAGSEPVPAPAEAARRPPRRAGWLSTCPAPSKAMLQNKDLTKSLDVRPSSLIYLPPWLDGGVLATARRKGDAISITGLRGKWTQVRLDKTLVAYHSPRTTAGKFPAGPAPAATPGSRAGAGMMPRAFGGTGRSAATHAPPPRPPGPRDRTRTAGPPARARRQRQSPAPAVRKKGKFATSRRLLQAAPAL